VLCCAVLCCAVLCCAVLCCAVLCCAVLCCAVLCVAWVWVANLMEVEGDDAMMLEAYSNPSAWFIVFVRPPVPCPLILILIS
jgi:hypothetical protein